MITTAAAILPQATGQAQLTEAAPQQPSSEKPSAAPAKWNAPVLTKKVRLATCTMMLPNSVELFLLFLPLLMLMLMLLLWLLLMLMLWLMLVLLCRRGQAAGGRGQFEERQCFFVRKVCEYCCCVQQQLQLLLSESQYAKGLLASALVMMCRDNVTSAACTANTVILVYMLLLGVAATPGLLPTC